MDDLGYLNSGLNYANSGLGIYQGATSGNPTAQARAGLQGAKLASNYLGGPSSFNTGATEGLDALNIYQGLQQGGVQGYGKAASSALQGAGALMDNPALSTAGGYIAAPLALYNFANNWKSGATGSDALSGAETGAAIGSVIPGIGTVIGGLVGGAAGALSSAFGPGAVDPESHAVQQVIDATSQYGNNPAVAAQAQNPYLELAGLMDRHSSTLPMYQQYGRMGEQAFTNDMAKKINSALQQNPNMTPEQMYSQVIDPWVQGMGQGYKNVGQTYTATTQGLLQDMVNQYMSGQAANDWTAIGGDSPFSNIYQGSPIKAVPAPAAPTVNRPTAGVHAGSAFAAQGGHVNNSVYDIITGRSMADRKEHGPHFDDGGYVSYTPEMLGYPISDQYTPPATDYSQFVLPNDSQSSLQNALQANTPTTGYDLSGNQFNVNENSNPLGGGLQTPAYLQSPGSVNGLGKTNISGLGSTASSLASLLTNPQILGALLGGGASLAGALGSNNGQNTMLANYRPTPPQMFQGSGPSASNMYGNFSATPRQRLNPTNIDYAHAGEQPTPGGNFFYSPMGGPPTAAASQQSPLQQYGAQMPQVQSASTNPQTQQLVNMLTGNQGIMAYNPVMHPITMQAHGGSIHEQGPLSRHMTPASQGGPSYIQGPGDGTSDDIDAKLSNGEYVMDAGTVAMLGNGSNEAGAQKLDQLRANLRRHAGESLAKGKQFMKAKAPEAYIKGGQS